MVNLMRGKSFGSATSPYSRAGDVQTGDSHANAAPDFSDTDYGGYLYMRHLCDDPFYEDGKERDGRESSNQKQGEAASRRSQTSIESRNLTDVPGDQAGETAQALTALFALTHEDYSDEQLTAFDDVLLSLTRIIEIEARRYISEKLSRLHRAPTATVRYLARDKVSVARPILLHSPILSDDDLIEIISSSDKEKCQAICARSALSKPVTSALLKNEPRNSAGLLARNHSAKFSKEGMDVMLECARNSENLQMLLGEREDLAEQQIMELVSIATERVRASLTYRIRKRHYGRLSHAAMIAAQRISSDFWYSRFDFGSAHIRVLKWAKNKGMDEATLRRFAVEDRFEETVVAFALLAETSVERAASLLIRRDIEPFLIVAKSIPISTISVLAMLKTGPWRHRLSHTERSETINHYQELKREIISGMICKP